MGSANRDLVIVGAGLSGLVLAHRVSERRDRKIIVVEAGRGLRGAYHGEHLSPTALRLIRDLGYGRLVEQAVSLELVGVQSFWGGIEHVQDYLFNRGGCGACISQSEVLKLLLDSCVRNEVQFYDGRVVALSRTGGLWRIALKSSTDSYTLIARCLVDATGRNAYLAKKLDVPQLSDRQVAIGCSVRRNDRAYEARYSIIDTSPLGWWYLSPVSDTSAVLILHTDLNGSRTIRSAENLIQSAYDVFHTNAMNFVITDFPVPFFRCASGVDFLSSAFGEGFAAIGDAAFAPDPISASGIANAISNACQVADRIIGTSCDEWSANINGWNRQHETTIVKHLATRDAFYSSEARWLDSSFWARMNRPGFIERNLPSK